MRKIRMMTLLLLLLSGAPAPSAVVSAGAGEVEIVVAKYQKDYHHLKPQLDHMIRQIAAELEIERAIEAVVRTEEQIPSKTPKDQVAWAKRTTDGEGCRLDFREEAAVDREVVAHELCHCRNDWRLLTVSGNLPAGVSESVREMREEKAWECAKETVRKIWSERR